MRNLWYLVGWEQWYFSIIWDTYMWKLQTFSGLWYKQIIAWFVGDIWHKYPSWYFKIVSNYVQQFWNITPAWYLCQISLKNHAIIYSNTCYNQRPVVNFHYAIFFSTAILAGSWSIYVSIHPSVHPTIRPSVCLSNVLIYFWRLSSFCRQR